MSREAHVRFWESAGVQLPRATHLAIVDERHLQRVLDEYVAYFNSWRPHRWLGQRAPCGSASMAPCNPTGRIIGQPVLGGLHHVYQHAA
jgi:transposase InsO family protein